MKAKDLMIGDWVCYNKPNGYYTQVNQIRHTDDEEDWYIEGVRDNSDSVSTGKLDLFHVDILKPIPLTEELLERHFPTDDELGWWPLSEEQHCPFHFEPHSAYMEGQAELNYVHELQHLLRLCKINKEIVL